MRIFEKIRQNINRPLIGNHLGMAERLHQRPGDHLVRIYAKWCEPDSRWRHLKLPTSLPVPNKAITGAHLIPRADDVACVVCIAKRC
jgi:hypothetical protein